MQPIYLDHAATTPLRSEVRAAMLAVLDSSSGNPSSIHAFGRRAAALLDNARARLANTIGAKPSEIVFTGGGTEANNLAVGGRAAAELDAPLACSAVEHRAVLRPMDAHAAAGRPVHHLPVDERGAVRMEALDALLALRPAVLSVMWANNETGAIQPVMALAKRCRAMDVTFHTDAVQALGKLAVDLRQVPATLATFSAHKLGGPKGTGALFVRRGTRLEPLLHGGSQEHGLRPGTPDVAGAVGMALAAELACSEREREMVRLAELRDRLEARLRAAIPELVVNAAAAERLPTILNVSLPGADPEGLLMGLDLESVAVSSGSACSSGAARPSHVLSAMGLPAEVAGPSLRISLGRETTDQEIDRAAEIIPRVAERVRAFAAPLS